MRHDPNHPRVRASRRGVALLMVLALVAAGTVMSMAVLSLGAMQARTLNNAARSARAEYLLEGGLQLGLYYLLHPDRSPVPLVPSALRDTVYYPGQSDLPLGPGGDRVDVSAELVGVDGDADLYRLAVTARPGDEGEPGEGPDAYARSRAVTVRVRTAFAFRHAGLFPGDYRLSGTWRVSPADPASQSGTLDVADGGLRGDGSLAGSIPAGSVGGPVYAANGAAVSGGSAVPIFPRAASVRWGASKFGAQFDAHTPAAPTYAYNGRTYAAQKLPDPTNGRVTPPAAWGGAPAASNPGNVWYVDGDVRFDRAATLDGTLIVRDYGSLRLDKNLTITARPGLPALAVTNDVRFLASGVTLKAVGLVYVGDNVMPESPMLGGYALDVRGALMTSWGGGPSAAGAKPPVPSNYSGKVTLRHDPSVLRMPDFSDVDRTPTSVEIVDWEAE